MLTAGKEAKQRRSKGGFFQDSLFTGFLNPIFDSKPLYISCLISIPKEDRKKDDIFFTKLFGIHIPDKLVLVPNGNERLLPRSSLYASSGMHAFRLVEFIKFQNAYSE